MNYIQHLNNFFARVQVDVRLSPAHISMYMALFQFWNGNRFKSPFPIYRTDVMQLSRIGSKNTYHKCLKELSSFKYIVHHVSPSKYKAVRITMLPFDRKMADDKHQLDLFASAKNDTSMCPKNDTSMRTDFGTVCVPNLTDVCPTSGTVCVPNMGHRIKQNINYKQNIDLTKETFKKNELKKTELDVVARVPDLGHTPGLNEVEHFFELNGRLATDGRKFFHHYEGTGWKIGVASIKNWQAVAKKWMLNNNFDNPKKSKAHDTGINKSYTEPL